MSQRRWGIIGFGEVGSTFARHLCGQIEKPVVVADPVLHEEPPAPHVQQRLQGVSIRLAKDIEDLVSSADVVLSTVTVGVAAGVDREAARTWREGLFIDLNSTEPGSKQRLASLFPGDSYVDGAILGAIKGEGAATPLALAGSRSGEALEAFQEVGFRASVTSPQVGAASALKLCRSVFMKGLECLFVETLLAARQFDLQQPVLETIEQTLRAYGLIPMADMLVTTHAVHCARRAREMDGAVSMLQEMGLPSAMSEASLSFLDGSSQTGLVEHFGQVVPDRLEEVLEFLTGHYQEQPS